MARLLEMGLCPFHRSFVRNGVFCATQNGVVSRTYYSVNFYTGVLY